METSPVPGVDRSADRRGGVEVDDVEGERAGDADGPAACAGGRCCSEVVCASPEDVTSAFTVAGPFAVPATVAELVTFAKLMATAAPIAAGGPRAAVAEPSAFAFASVAGGRPEGEAAGADRDTEPGGSRSM